MQPIRALEHPKFKELVDVVSRAKNGVEIPGQKSTRNQIKYLFKDYLSQLKVRLNVSAFSNCLNCSHCLQSPTVPGKINLTCDAWQASNTDGYFAVTAHWTTASTPTDWDLSSALIGFTRLNNAHVGVRLGQALFKVIKRLGIVAKVRYSVLCVRVTAHSYVLKIGHVTCDNASNNETMMKEFAARLENATGTPYDWKEHKIK